MISTVMLDVVNNAVGLIQYCGGLYDTVVT